MILPSSWNITVWTDSKSTIDRIEALRAKEPIKIMNEPEWQLLSLFMHIETLRTKPLTLRHIKSHTKLEDPISIGNATADLKADHARLWGKTSTIPRLPIHSYLAFRNYAMEDQLPQPPLITFKELRKYITTKMNEESEKPWKQSNSQSAFLHISQEPEQTIKYLKKELKGKHTGTLIDVLTNTITRPSYSSPEEIHCLYCKHVRKDHRIRPLTPEHLPQCLVNPHEKRSLLEAIQKEITTSWEPEWSLHTDTPDTTLKIAEGLVNLLQTRKKHSKLQIKTERAGWIGQIWPSDLDKLAIQYVVHHTENNLRIDLNTWMRALTKFLRQSDCGCKASKCKDTCKHQMNWSPPEHLQFLSNTLIGATTIRYANILQKSPSLQHVVNKHGADRLWGSCHPKDCTQDNYFYSPPNNDQITALHEAQNLKLTNVVDKTLGVVLLDEETLAEIAQSKLTLIATIPPRCINIHPHPNTRIPKKKGTTHLPIGLVLGITPATKTSNNTEVLIAINTLREWKKKYCPAATIHEDNFITELTNQPSKNFSLQKSDWHKAILEAWKWTTSPTGTQGIILSEDQTKVNCLKGSRKYNNLTKKVALQLFTFFAQEWENKNNMLPMRARQWWYKYNDEAEIVPPATRLRNKRKRQEKQKQIFKECMDIMHNKPHKRRKGNQNSQHAISAQNNPIPEAQSTPRVKICHCGHDLLTNNDGTPMIQCEACQTWLHISCTRLEPDTDLPDTFFCLDCNTRALNAPRKRKRRELAISMKVRSRIQQHKADPPTATWTCNTCTYHLNNSDEGSCGICHTKRPKNKKTVKESWWSGRVLPANALQKPDNPTEPTTQNASASDIIKKVQDKIKYSTQMPAVTRITSSRKTKPSTATQTLPPAPARSTYPQTTVPQATGPTIQTLTSPPKKARLTQPTPPQNPKNKRRRQETRNTSMIPLSTPPAPQQIRRSSHITVTVKRKPQATPSSSARPKKARNTNLTANPPPPSSPTPKHIPPEPPP
jgi:hypothetical protein